MSAVDPQTDKSVAVVGAGWAGCAAAVELADRGYRVALFEANHTLGGRARQVSLDGKSLDNGQHILLGAYSETLRLMKRVGIDSKEALLRLPLQMRYASQSGGMDFVAGRLPAPFHLFTALWWADGLAFEDKRALAKFSTAARWMGWQLYTDCSVSELLERFDQTARLIQLMWRPLCVAALNTPPEQASAQVFLNVLRDSLGARRAASDMLIPRTDLTALFPRYAADFVERHGGTVHSGTTVKSIASHGDRWHLTNIGGAGTENDLAAFDAVVVATQAPQASRLLDGLIDTGKLNSLNYEPITTCYLQYSPEVVLAQPLLALIDDTRNNEWAHFVFDRGQLDPAHAGLLAAVISTSSEAVANGHAALAVAVAAQLARALKRPQLEHPVWVKVITEKRATSSCTPGLERPENATSMRTLMLAGDYTAGEYPATLESAVRSGKQAANLLHRGLKKAANKSN